MVRRGPESTSAEGKPAGEVATGPGWTLTLGDCLEGMRSLEAGSVDAIVTDPPAGIGFMGNEWDADKGGRDGWVAWLTSVMAEAWRVIKPGGHALVWALPRTSHWTATAIENAGFEIRDVVMHLFGSGFPKSLDIAKQPGCESWQGFGTALKPAAEHWILARKPLAGTYAENVIKHGVGALNVDGCRIQGDMSGGGWGKPTGDRGFYAPGNTPGRSSIPGGEQNALGRWPAHLVLSHSDDCGAVCADGCPVRTLNEQALSNGMHSAGAARDGSTAVVAESYNATSYELPPNRNMRRLGDSGGASRFFYVAKAPRAEKDAGLEHLAKRSGGEATKRQDNSAGTKSPRAGAGRAGGVRNIHPTVKSIELMRWLVRLITPPNGLVLDMFAGSGTTGLGCVAEDMRFLGFEQSEEYFEIAKARLDANSRQQRLFAPTKTTNEPQPTQPSLFGETGGL